ncbi:MAG: siderophore biosynthesis protein [Gammaproteobacteria bacterium]|nr:siderophore biosynthesis protein [Gammaproteobacteria bacterium]MBU0849023.1 siderophore biosynthesis protein [Gammaproteobacteria bacterium]MBU1266685.1 siderophore biosynthesis protein [Gammaproteobacteria bacterium]MBU1529849.1 siderophore biosynthesis protein [Gammaproteobacteria bacterium]MBU1781360.1 siderophore biosynthesis protein [Gammaproteobacteria bacterium]
MHTFEQRIQQHQAEHHSLNHLLNCYLREFAVPQQLVDWHAQGDLPKALQSDLLAGETVRIRTAYPLLKIAFKVQARGALNQIKLGSKLFAKPMGKPWQVLGTHAAIQALLEHMAMLTQTEPNIELQAQIHNSLHNMQRFLAHAQVPHINALQHTEQSLLWGHPFHPSPKSRSGVDADQLLQCSPEVGAAFQLHWFEIDPGLLKELGSPVINKVCKVLTGRTGLYPCHPWETDLVLNSRIYQQAHQNKLIRHLGPQGKVVWPTSSVRTLYHPELDVFLKCSIHVRLTNCIRKNAWYELESAVGMTELLAHTFEQVEHAHPGFRMLREPAASTLDLSPAGTTASQNEIVSLQESFGIIFREQLQIQYTDIHMAGSLAAWDTLGQSQLAQLLCEQAEQHGADKAEFTLNWLQSYFKLLVPGTLTLLFKHGVVLEPHLQNTVLALDKGLPARVWIRDLEGTKLVPQHWPSDRLKGLSERAIASVHYSEDQGWKRVSYCLLVNNIAEMIFHACQHTPGLEQRAWQCLAKLIQHTSQALGTPQALSGLLQGHALASKNNLKTRLFKKADRLADYTFLSHPLIAHHDKHTEHAAY